MANKYELKKQIIGYAAEQLALTSVQNVIRSLGEDPQDMTKTQFSRFADAHQMAVDDLTKRGTVKQSSSVIDTSDEEVLTGDGSLSPQQ